MSGGIPVVRFFGPSPTRALLAAGTILLSGRLQGFEMPPIIPVTPVAPQPTLTQVPSLLPLTPLNVPTLQAPRVAEAPRAAVAAQPARAAPLPARAAEAPPPPNLELHHLISARDGTLYPEPGYSWYNRADPNDLRVRWVPRSKISEENPHVIAGIREGTWWFAPGYANVDASGKPAQGTDTIRWVPDLPYIDMGTVRWPHIHAAAAEHKWECDPGYAWVIHAPGQFAVKWVPNSAYRLHGETRWPHVRAGEAEGYWKYEDGYEWARIGPNGAPPANDLAVVPVGDPHSPTEKAKALRQHWTDYLKSIQESDNYSNWSGPPLEVNQAEE